MLGNLSLMKPILGFLPFTDLSLLRWYYRKDFGAVFSGVRKQSGESSSGIMLKNGETYHLKVFKVCLAIFQHYGWEG